MPDTDIAPEAITPLDNKFDWNSSKLISPFNAIPPESNLTTIKIWETSEEGNRAYNHFPMIHQYKNRLYLLWMTHNYDEHGSGQTLSWTYSYDYGKKWTPVTNLFESLANIDAREYSSSESYYMTPVVL